MTAPKRKKRTTANPEVNIHRCFVCRAELREGGIYQHWFPNDNSAEGTMRDICMTCFTSPFYSSDPHNLASSLTSSGYEYNPRVIHYTKDGPDDMGVFYGVELETDSYPHGTASTRRALRRLRNDFVTEGVGPTFWIKSDGSLYDGIEIAFHPRTPRAWNKFLENGFLRMKEVIESIGGGKSYNTGTCGLHIHRQHRDINAEMNAKLAWFLRTCQPQLEKLAQRRNNGYCSFNMLYHRNYDDYVRAFNTGGVHGRGVVCFHSGHRTTEFRLFKGTLAPDTIGGQIGFADSLMVYLKEHLIVELQEAHGKGEGQLFDHYLQWVDKGYRSEALSQKLYKLLMRKGFFTLTLPEGARSVAE